MPLRVKCPAGFEPQATNRLIRGFPSSRLLAQRPYIGLFEAPLAVVYTVMTAPTDAKALSSISTAAGKATHYLNAELVP